MKKVSICIVLDSLALGSGWKLSPEKDPTYKLVDERLIKVLEKSGIKVTLFVVGKDLESSDNRKYLKKWSQAGHEIGNHTYSHLLNLASLSQKKLENEIVKNHELIDRITGKNPIHFITPGWGMSQRVADILSRLNYRFDLSPFPSPWFYLVLAKQWWRLRGSEERKSVWSRRKLLHGFGLMKKTAWTDEKRGITYLPLPTVTWLRIPIWHTGWFIFGEILFEKLLKFSMKHGLLDYYLLHPADIVDFTDVPDSIDIEIKYERIQQSVDQKIKLLTKALKIITQS